MLADSNAFSGFAVDDLAAVREFYTETLGLNTSEPVEDVLLSLDHPGGRSTLVYVKPDFEPATYTVLNFPVGDVEATVDGLTSRGVVFERYEGFDQDEKGISRSPAGPLIAWFKDPAGNILSVLEES
ncbi:MAG TPA: VOC family protein [Solirubrobacterales bacterium]|nr:VOC family protein [Solirubrobacterales bacterium]